MRGLAWWLLAAALALAVAQATPAAAHPESAAPLLRSDVVAAGHEPQLVEPHTQWQGFLELEAGSNITAAYYQVCRVGQSCFAPPTESTLLRPDSDGGRRFQFDTTTYLANGKPVDYEAGWRIGVTWILEERLPNGTTQMVRFPLGPDLLAPECQGDGAQACAEAHYLAFDIPAERGAPMAPLVWILAALLGAAVAVRRRR